MLAHRRFLWSALVALLAAAPSFAGCEALAEISYERAYGVSGWSSFAQLSAEQRGAYTEALRKLEGEGVEALVAGDLAFQQYTGLGRKTQTLELHVGRRELAHAESALLRLGFRRAQGALVRGDARIEITTDDSRPFSSPVGALDGVNVGFVSAEELIWKKTQALERYRFDWHDAVNILRLKGASLDWPGLVARFGNDAERLRLLVRLYDYVYPAHHDQVPQWVRTSLANKSSVARSRPKLAETGAPLIKDFDMEAATAPKARTAYVGVMQALRRANVPFLVGGTYATKAWTGAGRSTKDLDLHINKEDLPRAMAALRKAGYGTSVLFPHWLAKAYDGEVFVDIIFDAGNKLSPVDASWFSHAKPGTLFDVPVRYAPVEEEIWIRSYVMERERFDAHDIAALLEASRGKLDWRRLIDRFGDDWEVLRFQLELFRYLHPDESQLVPDAVMSELATKSTSARPAGNNGPRLSRGQYLGTLGWGDADTRLSPRGKMSPSEVDAWTSAIIEKK